jgi:hypothetical protein
MTFDPNLTQRLKVAVRRRVVPNWRSRLRDFSTIALGLGTAAVPVWAGLPEDLRSHLPAGAVAWSIGVLNAWGLVGKFLVQAPKE